MKLTLEDINSITTGALQIEETENAFVFHRFTKEEEELYKLHTVASRFGGRAARKMLIVTRLQKQKPASAHAFIQRARDMGIYLVTDAASLTKLQWQEIFQNAMA